MPWSRLIWWGVISPLLCAPVLMVVVSWLFWDAQSAQVWQQMRDHVLPAYAWTSLQLAVLVGIGVTLLGVGAATTVALFEFKGRRFFEWALLLPLAQPAYVMAYAYTDFLQFSGPLQTTVRELTGWQGRVFPEVRSVWGAALVLTCALYPYVYLLARAALLARAPQLMEAARLLGASLPRRVFRVALPMVRPAVMAGVALALMETFADYGVASYFGIQTFTTGIYKAWLVMDNPIAAAQLATVLLACVLFLVILERKARHKSRFALVRGSRSNSSENAPLKLEGAQQITAWLLCLAPLMGGFILPLMFMLRPLLSAQTPWDMAAFAVWSGNSLILAAIASVLAVALALGLLTLERVLSSRLGHLMNHLVGLGYAVPGVVVVIGLLLPLASLQRVWPGQPVGYWLTATVMGLLWAYLVRFTAVALHSIQGGYVGISKSLDDSARTLGHSGWQLGWRIHWPMLTTTTQAALILVFVDVMKELPATLVLRPFNFDTLAVMAHQLARDERLGEAALPSLALVVVGMLPVYLLSRTLRK